MNLLFLSIILCSLSNIGVAQSIQIDHQLLWEISGNELTQPSYLYGSYHSNDKRVFHFSDSTYFALDKAEVIVLETDIYGLFEELDVRKKTANMLYDNEGNPYTASNKASKTNYGDEDGMPQFLDAFFLQYAYNHQKGFFPLESIESQLNLLSDFPNLTPSFSSLEALMISQERIMDVYLTGDIYKIDKLMRTSLELYPGLYERIITQRNHHMADGIDSVIQQQTTFCAIGAGHLAGNEGVINLLRAKGYHLRPIIATYEDEAEQKKSLFKKKHYHHIDTSTGLNVLFPGKPLETEIHGEQQLIYRELGQGNSYIIEYLSIDSLTSIEELAETYLVSPTGASYTVTTSDDGMQYAQGIIDVYPEGLVWMRILISDKAAVLIKAYGGNKFMNSNRPEAFFNRVWFE